MPIRRRVAVYVNDIDLLKSSSYFDAAFYRERYPDTAEVDPYRHYLEHGGLEERWPSAHFDPVAYRSAYADVRASGANPLIHFLREGMKAQRWAGLVPPISHGDGAAALSEHEIADVALVKSSTLFDAQWYSKMHQDLEGLAPAEHYLRIGAGLGWSPSQAFDGPAYSRLHPDIGRMNPLLHYLKHGRREGRPLGITTATRVLIERELSALAMIEPDLMADDRLHSGLERLPLILSLPATKVSECWRRLWARVGPETEHLVLVPWLVRGGADLAAVNVVKALQEQAGIDRVVIIATDHATISSADWLPQGTRLVVLAEDALGLSIDDRKTLVEKLIWTLRPRSVFNVNSLAGWEAVAHTGRALARMTQFNALLFCADYTADGRAAGYSDTHFRAALPYLHRVYFDTRYFIEELQRQYGLPPTLAAKLHYLPQPSAGGKPLVPPSRAGQRPRIVWAGRFAAQKNVELLMKIVENGASFEFDIWGSGQPEIEAQLVDLAGRCGNVHLKGTFASLAELPLGEYAAFLFTSHYEGMPTIILNIAAMGLPIVATAVGGVGEVVNEKTGWPIAERHDPRPYLLALAEVVSDPGKVEAKVAAMQDQLATSRSWQNFREELLR
jgi:glycosyltransferase involved in cell wall biosynthesis